MNGQQIEDSMKFFNQKDMVKTIYPKGTVIYLEGSPISGLHCLLKGKVKIYRNEIDGKEIILKYVTSEEYLSHRCFFTRKCYGLSAATVEDSEILFLEGQAVVEALKSNIDVGSFFIKLLSEELSEADSKLSFFMTKNVGQRLAHFLLSLCDSWEKSSQEKNLDLDLILSREEIASTIGTSPETVTRYMTKFKDYGWIAEAEHRLRILSPEQLQICSTSRVHSQ